MSGAGTMRGTIRTTAATGPSLGRPNAVNRVKTRFRASLPSPVRPSRGIFLEGCAVWVPISAYDGTVRVCRRVPKWRIHAVEPVIASKGCRHAPYRSRRIPRGIGKAGGLNESGRGSGRRDSNQLQPAWKASLGVELRFFHAPRFATACLRATHAVTRPQPRSRGSRATRAFLARRHRDAVSGLPAGHEAPE